MGLFNLSLSGRSTAPALIITPTIASSPWKMVRKLADETRAVAALADDNNLITTVEIGTYQARGLIFSTQPRSDIAANIAIGGPAASFLQFRCSIARMTPVVSNSSPVGGAEVVAWRSAYNDATPWNPTGGTANPAQNVYLWDGVFVFTAAGNLAIRWQTSNAAGPVTLKAGSFFEVARV